MPRSSSWKLVSVIAIAAGCVPEHATTPSGPAPVVPAGPPRTFTGELRDGDDTCPNLCDRYRFTWAVPTEVSVNAVATGASIFIKVEAPSWTDTGDFGSRSSFAFTAEPNVEYTVIVDAYNYYDKGAYTLEVSPPAQVEIPAPERPVPLPPTPEELEPDDVLPGKIAELTTGWKLAKTTRGDLATVPALTWSGKRGRCYFVVMVLEAGARKNDDWLWVSFRIDSAREYRSTSGGFLTGSRRVIQAASGEGLCPSRGGKLIFELPRHDTSVPVKDAGNGPFRVELYEQPISTKLLDERDRADDEDYCRACVKQQTDCLSSGDTGIYTSCTKQFSACLYQRGMTRKQCEP
jgi:hypothetical protein